MGFAAIANVDCAMPICPKRGVSWNGVEAKIKHKSGFSSFWPSVTAVCLSRVEQVRTTERELGES